MEACVVYDTRPSKAILPAAAGACVTLSSAVRWPDLVGTDVALFCLWRRNMTLIRPVGRLVVLAVFGLVLACVSSLGCSGATNGPPCPPPAGGEGGGGGPTTDPQAASQGREGRQTAPDAADEDAGD